MGGEQRHYKQREAETTEATIDELPVVEPEIDMDEVEKLLDEIDGVLEANAVEFVASYRQLGGE